MTSEEQQQAASDAIDARPYSEVQTIRLYAANAPDVPNRYGSGSLKPADIAITYHRYEDGRREVTSNVEGAWRKPNGELTNAPLDQRYCEPLDDWPDWLAGLAHDYHPEARDHRPSRFTAPPAQVDSWLRRHFAEDTLLRFYQWIGAACVAEASEDLREFADAAGPAASRYHLKAADRIDPAKQGGPYPSSLTTLFPCPCGGAGPLVRTDSDGRHWHRETPGALTTRPPAEDGQQLLDRACASLARLK